jgi:hypothetical protein
LKARWGNSRSRIEAIYPTSIFSGWLTIFVVDGLTYEVRTVEGDRRDFGRHRDALDVTLLDGGAERWGVECAFMRERGFD